MGFLDFFKKKEKTENKTTTYPISNSKPPYGMNTPNPMPQYGMNNPITMPPYEMTESATIPPSEKQYYRPDEYYTYIVGEGTGLERRVVPFEERKKTAIPSKRGLYPAEILLLEYCSGGKYPNPKSGYPAFWWFTYGIRNVGAALKRLEERGFIVLGSARDSIGSFTMAQLKELLAAHNQPTTGKKADLVARVAAVVPDCDLINAGAQAKYALTEIGQAELSENEYVSYMHSLPNTTTEDSRFGLEFNVWSINRLLGYGDKSNWKAVVDEQEYRMKSEADIRYNKYMQDLKLRDPEIYQELKSQDEQLEAVQNARDKYDNDKDLESYISFWEELWANGGLLFEGSGWHFELPDLYIKAKRYDDALALVLRIKNEKPIYSDKADTYIIKIGNLKDKHNYD